MDSITLQNYRCFGSEEQTARLAPLTLLVGPNSTGKTSFLALIRALWDVAFREVVPNFREEPFDLGSFEEIVYRPRVRNDHANKFCVGFSYSLPLAIAVETVHFACEFENDGTIPFPVVRTYVGDSFEVRAPTARSVEDQAAQYRIGIGDWKDIGQSALVGFGRDLPPLSALRYWLTRSDDDGVEAVHRLLDSVQTEKSFTPRPFGGAAVRSRPRRTYDPSDVVNDGEGYYIPSYLAHTFRQNPHEWSHIKRRMEEFGQESQLFDEISVRSLGGSQGDPFQIQVRRFSGPRSRRRKGPWRNLMDVGYGVSQALPVLTELLRIDAPWRLLLQQPEVHLHPQAQAALGTLFCQVAAGGRQLVVETHSDYIIDRVRMDVRDQTTGLKPEDVSILYFEPRDLDVKIHSIRLDGMGNVLDAPPSYGQFFMDEINRSIGLVKPDVRDSRQ